MNPLTIVWLIALYFAPLAALPAAEATTTQPIDRETLDRWSAPYRGWHYQPEHVIPAHPNIPGHANFKNTDVPCVNQLPGQPDKWFMSFIAFNGKGYNAKSMPAWIEQIGGATSTDLLKWQRFDNNPIVPVWKGGYDEKFCADGKVFRDGDHWVMFYFGVGQGGAHIMAALLRDLIHWTSHPEPLYKAGGNPSGLDQKYAHKISLVGNPANETFYLYYCATGNKGRGIGLITSKPLSSKPPATGDDEAGAANPESRVFDARAFGARGDDATDNTEAFSRCLKAVVEAGGGRVVLPDGVYRGHMIIPPVSRPSPSWITVEITGEHEPTHVFGTTGDFPLQNRGTILKCLEHSGSSVITAAKSNQSLTTASWSMSTPTATTSSSQTSTTGW